MRGSFIFLVLVFLLCGNITTAQQIRIFNKYLEPIEHVELISLKTGDAIYTNEKGTANVKNFPKDDTLLILHSNYEPLKLSLKVIREKLHNDIILHYKTIFLEGVEATITVRNRRKKEATRPIQLDVLDNEDLHKVGAQTSAEVLEETTGVLLQKSQAGGGSPIIRGMEANKVLLVVDGIRMNNAIYRGGHLQNSITIDNNILEQVDVSYGPGSVIYGSDALGGVIHYYTKNPIIHNDSVLDVNGVLSSSYTSGNNGKMVHTDISLGKGKWGSLTSVTAKDLGDVTMGKRRVFGNYPTWGKVYNRRLFINGIDSMVVNTDTNTQLNTGYKQLDLLQKVVFKPNQKVSFTLNTQYSNSSRINRYDQLTKYKNNQFKYAEWYYGPQGRFLSALTTTIKDTTNRFFDNANIIASFQHLEESRITRKFKKKNRITRVEKVNVGALNLDFSKYIAYKMQLFYGAEFTHNDVHSKASSFNISTENQSSTNTRYPDGGSTMNAQAVYAKLEQNFDKIMWSFGNRLTLTQLDANFKDTSLIHLPFNNIKANSKAFSTSFGVVYTPDSRLKIHTNLSSGFRSPNIDDFGKVFEKNGYVVVPNNNLKPEFAYTGEFGFSTSFYRDYIELDSTTTRIHFATLSVTGFYTLLDNMITKSNYQLNGNDSILYEGDMAKIQANVNFDKGAIYGITGGVNLSFNRNFKLKSTINYTVGRITSVNQPMPHIPPLFGRTSFLIDQPKWDFEFYTIYNGWKKINDFAPNGVDNADEATAEGIPAWFTLNLRGSYQFSSRFLLSGGIQNIMDVYYKTFASGVSGMGRSITLSFRYNF